jgi:FCD domain
VEAASAPSRRESWAKPTRCVLSWNNSQESWQAGQFSGRETLLQRQADKVRRAYEKGNMQEYARHDLAFHRMIVAVAGNQVLLENWDALHFDIRTRLFLGHSSPNLQSTLDLHDETVKALIQGKRNWRGGSCGCTLKHFAQVGVKDNKAFLKHSSRLVGNPEVFQSCHQEISTGTYASGLPVAQPR